MRKKIIFIYAIVKHLRRFYEKEIEFCVFIKDQMTGNRVNVVNILIGNNNKKKSVNEQQRGVASRLNLRGL